MPTPAIELGPILPELIVVGVGVVLLLAGVVVRKASPTTLLVLCLGGIAAAAVATVRLWDWEGGPAVLAGSISTDRFGVVVRLIILGVAALGAVLGHHYFERSGEGRVLSAAAVRDGRDDAVRRLGRPDHGVPRARDPFAVPVRADRFLHQARLGRGRDEVLPARLVLLGLLPVRDRDGLRRVGFYTAAGDRRRARRPNGFGRPRRDRDGAARGGVRVQGVGGAVPHVDARRLSGSADRGDRLHVRRNQGRGIRRLHPRVQHLVPADHVGLAAGRGDPGGGLDRGGEPPRDRANRHQAPPRVLEHQPRRVRLARAHGGGRGWDRRGPVLPRGVRGDRDRGVRRGHGGLGQGRAPHVALGLRRTRAAEPRGGWPAHPVPALARRDPPDGRLRGQGGGLPSRDRGRVLVPGVDRRARERRGGLRLLAGHRADVHARAGGGHPSGRVVVAARRSRGAGGPRRGLRRVPRPDRGLPRTGGGAAMVTGHTGLRMTVGSGR